MSDGSPIYKIPQNLFNLSCISVPGKGLQPKIWSASSDLKTNIDMYLISRSDGRHFETFKSIAMPRRY